MLKKFEVSGVHTIINDNLRKYIDKKLGKIDKYLSKQARESAHMEVFLKEGKQGGKKLCTCSVVLHLPHDTIKVSESTINMYAAVDIVQAKLKLQIDRYKEVNSTKRSRRLFDRARRLNLLPGRTANQLSDQ